MDDTRGSHPPPRRHLEVPDPVWPSTEWPAGPITRPITISDDDASGFMPKPPRRRDRWTLVLGLLGGALLGTGVTLGVLGLLGILDTGTTSVTTTTLSAAPTTAPPPPLSSPTPNVTEVAATAVPSIVAVEVVGPTGLGGGSGVVYTADGFIITNHHVVEDTSEVAVVFADGIRYPADVVGSDPLTDIAVLSTPRPDLTPIRVGTNADLVIGERAVAVGNPLGLRGGPSVTTGILSATGRSLMVEADTILYGLLQTDAPITRGSSGGALLDQEAKLIGITTAIGVSDVGAEGLGFAVPVDLVVSVADDLIADGSVDHGLLGIEGTTTTETIDGAEIPLGVVVSSMLEPSGYSNSGGREGDVIVRLQGQSVTSIDGLIAQLRRHRAGDEVVLDVLRGDEQLTFSVTLDNREAVQSPTEEGG